MNIDTTWRDMLPSTLEKIQKQYMNLEASAMKQHEEMHLPSSEGVRLLAGSWMGRKIGVFTSGGDSQGMNAAVRAIVRVGMYIGCKVFYIHEGYQGMVDGGDNIVEATWFSTSNMIHVGGTVIGSARCMDFKERWGRLKAAQNLIENGITNLIAIGGDGSLRGAYCFRKEWPSLLRELVDREILNQENIEGYLHLNIVGLVGSIDNDFCGTDMTIGTDSALHRIQEAIDNIMTTAVSHKRAFVLEIMGRMCGYLPLMAGISSEATSIFIPEDPPVVDWRQQLCDQLLEKSQAGEVRRTHIVLVAEGAMDHTGNKITCPDVQKVLTDKMKMDVRVTVLGHVQRGGNTSAFDRILATRMGAEAVVAIMQSTPETPPYVISLNGFEIVRTPLMKAVEQTSMIGELLEDRNFDEVVKLRGPVIYQNLFLYLMQRQVLARPMDTPGKKCRSYRIAMIHVGAPAGGMNAAARGFVGVCVNKGFEPVFIYDSWRGLLQNKVRHVEWNDVHHWTSAGGSLIGTNCETASKVGILQIARKLDEHNISGLIIVGGFEAFQSAYEICQKRKTYPELCIPINLIPATIANNVPGVAMSLGCDTALNQICTACDELKRSAFSIQKCVFVTEVGGGNCGFLATMCAIAAGADHAFINEEEFTIRDLQQMCRKLKNKLEHSGVEYGLILRNENANENLTTDFMQRLFNEEGQPVFTAKSAYLGHAQGFLATPHDRCAGVKNGCRSAAWVILTMKTCGAKQNIKVFTDKSDTVTVTTSKRGKVDFTPIDHLARETDFVNCRPITQWWMKLRRLLYILSWPDQDLESELK